MIGRTHDLAAFTALSYIIATSSIPSMTLATAIVAFSANMVGGLAPDLDQSTAALWHKIRAGSFLGKLIAPILGGHRFISHSLLGVFLCGVGLDYLLRVVGIVLLVDMQIVWWAFMIGFVSHLLMDSLTRDGVPWLFPIPIRLGFPPLRFLRIKTGGTIEKTFVFPCLLAINIYLYYHYYPKFLNLLHTVIK